MFSTSPRLRLALGLAACVLGGARLPAGDAKPGYPPPPPTTARQAAEFGTGVQRTMTLLAGSTPHRHNKVRILFYGQSITEQDWWKRVVAGLRRRFPDADIEAENRAIGGFASQLLVRPAEHDLYPLYPDLLIFHVYGADNTYEEIIKNVRSRTTAEILMQRDHVTAWPPEHVDPNKDKGAWWDDHMNNHFLADTARKYGCGLADVRGMWLDYLRANKLEPRALLKDGVHLNDHGNYLMAELVQRHLVYRPELPADGWRDLVRTYEVGRDVAWQGGKLILPFDGNRVDVVAGRPAEGAAASAKVLIDGKPPSAFGGCYRITRPQPGPWSPVALTRVDHDKPLQVEDWTLTVTSVGPDSKEWKFSVTGSKTGPDGDGESGKPFASKSGRVRIAPESWFRNGSLKVPEGYRVTWQVLPMFADRYEAPKADDPVREQATTLGQGLPNGPHTLELIADGGRVVPVQAVRVYRPPVQEAAKR